MSARVAPPRTRAPAAVSPNFLYPDPQWRRHMATAREAATAVFIFTVGDVAAQQIEYGSVDTLAPISAERTGGASALGFIWGGVVSPSVYKLNERLFPGRSPASVAKKILFSFVFLGNLGNWSMIFSRRMLAGGQTTDAAQEANAKGDAEAVPSLLERARATARSVNADFPTVISHDIKVWPPTDLIVFSLVPIRLRVAFVSSVSVCWHTYISFTASQGTSAVPAEAATALDHGGARADAPPSLLVRRSSSRPPPLHR